MNFCSCFEGKKRLIFGKKDSSVFYNFFSSEKRKLTGHYSRMIKSTGEGILL